MAEDNFTDFMMNILQGIGYGKVSQTNRAYNWIRKHSNIEGHCLIFLKNHLSSENFITLKEMNMFKELEKQGNVPFENEIDDLLSEYINESSSDAFYPVEDRILENELKQSSKYFESLELEEKFLKRQCNKLQDEIKFLESTVKIEEEKLNSALTGAENIDILYNNAVKQVQQDLVEISTTFENLSNENGTVDRHNIFGMNFETFRDINSTFQETVNAVIQKQTCKTTALNSVNLFPTESGQRDLIPTALMQSDQKNKLEELISLAESLGKCSYRLLKLKCEETELNELNNYLEDLLNSSECKNINMAKIKVHTDENFDVTYDLQKKIIPLSEALEKYYNTSTVKSILVDNRSRLEQRLKSDRKYLRKISDLCVKFVDLMTLQACLSYNEVENVNWAISLINYGFNKLESHLQNHNFNINNIKKMLDHQKSVQLRKENRTSISTVIGFDGNADISNVQVTSSYISTLQNNLLLYINNRMKEFSNLTDQINEINEVIFNGPLRQAFFSDTLLNDELLVMKQCTHFTDQYNSWKLKFHEESEKLKASEYEKLQKSLGVLFLTDPETFIRNFNRLKHQVSEKKGFSNTIATVRTDHAGSSLNSLAVRKGNMSTY